MTKTTVTQISKPPILGVLTSFSLCKLLKIVASSPVIVFVLAAFFQSLCLYKKLVSRGDHKIAIAEATAAKEKTLIALKAIVFILTIYRLG